jgi:triosephosphate isomerase (TIM)
MAATGRQHLVAGNWKMNGLRADGTALAQALVERARGGGVRCTLAVCPPAPLLDVVGQAIAGSGIGLGGQDCCTERSGAYTGDISAWMLADAGCRYVIVGHSERRAGRGETDALVRAKATAAHAAGLTAIICIGETEAERLAGQALAVVGRQLAGSVPDGASAANTVIAYEPVWAIGTGRTPTPADVREVHAHLRSLLRGRFADGTGIRILYGGSVKPDNAAVLLTIEDVDGALVGGASLKADDFWKIAAACP